MRGKSRRAGVRLVGRTLTVSSPELLQSIHKAHNRLLRRTRNPGNYHPTIEAFLIRALRLGLPLVEKNLALDRKSGVEL